MRIKSYDSDIICNASCNLKNPSIFPARSKSSSDKLKIEGRISKNTYLVLCKAKRIEVGFLELRK